MKNQSFEAQLRQTTPPTPDPEARLRARRAALLEFERVHAQQAAANTDAAPTPAPVRSSWRARNTMWGGVATACVVVVGVSVYWLMPPKEREIKYRVQATPDVELEPQVVTQGRLVEPPQDEPQQAEPRQDKAQQDERRQEPKADESRKNERVHLAITPKKKDQPLSPAYATPFPAPLMEKQELQRGAAVSAEIDSTAAIGEVTVQGTPRKVTSYDSPSPVTVISGDSGSLEEVTVTQANGGLRAKLRGLFGGRKEVSAPSSVPAPKPTVSDEGRDKFQHFETNPVKRVADEPVSTFSVDVDTASYSFVRRQLNAGVLPQPDAVRVEEMINYFDYAWPAAESRDEPFKPTVAVTDSPWGEGKKLIHIGIKGYELPVQQQPDVNLVLLLDVSGSMDSPDKLPLAQRSMALLLDSLKPSDTVGIVVYAGAAGLVLQPTPVSDKQTILDALNSLRPGGSTAGAEGIRLAYELAEKSFRKNGVNRILLATDGDFNVGITDQNELKGYVEREREKGVFLSVLGFGQGNYRDEMAQTLAQNGNGVAAYIDTLSEAKKVLVQESTAALFTIAKDVKLQIEFNPKTVEEYRLVGYETRALNREDFNNDKVDAGDVGSGHAVTAIYEITPVGSKSSLFDKRRYADENDNVTAGRQEKASEYGFLKIRYKLPKAVSSRLIEQPILMNAGVPANLERDVTFSTAVAGFAQLMRNGKYTGALKFDDVIDAAERGLGNDRFGYRAEFIDLVRKAKKARGM
jgi:Ca-activated chloride channel family protein